MALLMRPGLGMMLRGTRICNSQLHTLRCNPIQSITKAYIPNTSLAYTPFINKNFPIIPARSFSSSQRRREDSPKEISKDQELENIFHTSSRGEAAQQLDLKAKLQSNQTSPNAWTDIKRLLKMAMRERKSLFFAIIMLVTSSLIGMTIPATIGKIMDFSNQRKDNEQKALKTYFFGFEPQMFYTIVAGVLVFGAACNFGRVVLLRIVGERVVARTRSKLYEHTFRQDAEFFDANRHGDLISRLSNDTVVVAKSITQNLADGLRSVISASVGLGMMFYVSFTLTSYAMFIVPPIALGAVFYGRYIRTLTRRTQDALGELTRVSEERLGNVRTAQAFSGDIPEVRRYNIRIRNLFDLAKKEAIATGGFNALTGVSANLSIVAILAIGGNLVSTNAITLGELTSFLMYTAYCASSLAGLSSFYSELMKGVGASSRLFELMDRKPSIPPTVGDPVKDARGVIEFDDVSFAYPTRPAVNIFEHLKFKIQPGQNVAIVGQSGSGKSSISSLLFRFYDPVNGSIKINGVDIRSMNLKQLRRHIGIVSQEPVLFSGTIRENIAYGKPDASRYEILRAAQRANCQFIADFPKGLETEVGPRGGLLSGGQKQRIAIARALIKNPSILILDEATSALDSESETLVNEALQNLMKEDNTTISIAHRLATIRRADRILVLGQDGKLAEEGTYDQLSSNADGAFSKLMKFQMYGNDGKTQKSLDDIDSMEETAR